MTTDKKVRVKKLTARTALQALLGRLTPCVSFSTKEILGYGSMDTQLVGVSEYDAMLALCTPPPKKSKGLAV